MTESQRTILLPRAELEGVGRIDTDAGPVLLFGQRRPGAGRASEDSILVHAEEDHLFLIVADGAGGHSMGGEASEAAVRAMASALGNSPGVDFETRMRHTRRAAAAAVARLGEDAITTVAIAHIHDNVLTTWHAGDSTILLMGQRGRRKLRTTDHTPPGLDVAAGKLTLDEARARSDRNLLVNALGSEEVGWESGGPIPLGRYDTLVLATDGLFDNLSDDEIVERLRKGDFVDGVTRMLEDNAIRMRQSDGDWPGKPDDVAVVAYRTR